MSANFTALMSAVATEGFFSFALSTFTQQAGSSSNTVLYCNIVCSVHSVDVSLFNQLHMHWIYT